MAWKIQQLILQGKLESSISKNRRKEKATNVAFSLAIVEDDC